MNNKIFIADWEKVTEQAYSSAPQIVTNLWHKRLDHFNQRSIVEMNEKDLVEDLPKISHESKIC